MAASGMRYKKTLQLVEQIKEKQKELQEKLKTLSEDRTAEVSRAYGGEAADNFKNNTVKIAEYINSQLTEVINKLTTEAETQHDAYIAQEQRLKSNVDVAK